MNNISYKLKTEFAVFIFCVAPTIVSGQIKIEGIITDQNKIPLAGATIVAKEQNIKEISNNSGFYSISANKGDTLVYSYEGFLPSQQVVQENTKIDVSLVRSDNQLNEVVVTALGIKKQTRRIGYATQSVDATKLITARDPSPIGGLIGKVAGLSVGPSAELLGNPSVLIRGNSISLYVVDGFPINTDTYNISPDDIDSYTVLKGPSAAALYGSRAQNGAILISTKKGDKLKKGLTVEINSSTAINTGFLAFPRIQNLYGAGENTFYTFVDGKGGAPGGVDADYDIWGPYFAGQLIPQYDSPVINGVRQATPYTARGKDNLKNFLKTGYQLNNNISLVSRGDTYTNRLSISQQHQNSYIPYQYLDIANANFYSQLSPSKNWKFEANVNFNRQSTNNFPDVQYGPNSIIYNIALWTGADWDIKSPDIRSIWKPNQEGIESIFAEYARYHNPYLLTKKWTRGHYKNDIYAYLSTNLTINDNLNLSLRSQINTYNILRTEKLPYSAHPYGREGNQGDYREDRRSLFDNNTELLLNYNYMVKDFVNLSGVIGSNLRNFNYSSSWTSTDYLNIPEVYTFSNSKNPVQSTNFNSAARVLSAYYLLDATFGKYATLSSTGRFDKSSAFPEVTTYFYPSLCAATVISDYVALPDLISFFKARGSFATVKADSSSPTIGPAPFNTISAFGAGASTINNPNSTPLLLLNPLSYGSTYNSPYNGPNYQLNPFYLTSKPYNNQPAASGSDYLYHNNIKNYVRVNYEEGFDIKFLKNRLGLSATFFQYIDGPQILANPISSSTGYSSIYINGLKTRKSGAEFSIDGTPIKSPGGFSWNVLANLASFTEKYIELPAGQEVYQNFFRKGDRSDKLYATAFAKSTSGEIIHDASGKPLALTVPQYLGNMNADFYWGFSSRFQYKDLSLSFQFDGSVGGLIVNTMHNKSMRGGSNIETVQGELGAARFKDWQNFGDNKYQGTYIGKGVVVSNGIPISNDPATGKILNIADLQFEENTKTVLVQDYVSKYYNIDEANLMSKTFTKLREVVIAYDLPKAWLGNLFIDKASVSIYGRNLLYFYKDQRFRDVDLDQYNYASPSTVLQSPTVRSYGFNFNVSF